MKVLFTAFKGKQNMSFQLVKKISKDALFLTNSFQGLEKDISLIVFEYNKAIMFGIDKTLNNQIRIETCAKYNEELIYSNFDITTLENKLKDFKIPYITSSNPTNYLCNAAYYHMLKKNSNTVFIHIPSINGMNEGLLSLLIKFFDKLK